MIDRYGRPITDNEDGSYSVEGIVVIAAHIDAAIATFNLMAPSDWTEPSPTEPSDPSTQET